MPQAVHVRAGDDAGIRNLLQTTNGGILSMAKLQSLREELFHCREWSTEMALDFGRMVVVAATSNINNNTSSSSTSSGAEHCALVLNLFHTRAMDQWEDHVLYAVLVLEQDSTDATTTTTTKNRRSNHDPSNPHHLLDLLLSLSTQTAKQDNNSNNNEDTIIRHNATICLAKAWQCLQRLNPYTTLDGTSSPWWLPEEQLATKLGTQSLQCLDAMYRTTREQQGMDDFSLQPQPENANGMVAMMMDNNDQLKVAVLTILSTLLRHQALDLSSALSSMTPDASTLSNLLKEIQVLNNSVLSPSSSEYTLPIAMLSLSALSFLQRASNVEHQSLFHDLNQTIQSTGLVENLVRLVFLPKEAPRWAQSSNANRYREEVLRSIGLDLFSCWKICDAPAWKVLVANLEPKLPIIIDQFWLALMDDNNDNINENLTRVLWLHLLLRSHTRFRLNVVLERMNRDAKDGSPKESPHKKILRLLFGSLRLSSKTAYSNKLVVARFLRVLLSDKRSACSNDGLSRDIWKELDDSFVENHFQTVLEHACTQDANQPLLLALFDTLEILLEQSHSCNGLVETLGAHNLESLIYLVKPNTIRFDFAVVEEAADIDTETPPLHNLSRMDENSICIEHEETKSPRGLDHSMRLSVATSLAHLAYGGRAPPSDESVGVLVARLSTVVHDFLAEYHSLIEESTMNESNLVPSMDQIKRFVRLRNKIATCENEDFLSTSLFTSLSLRRHTLLKHIAAQAESQQKLERTRQREQTAQQETASLQQQLKKQSILFQREMSRVKTNLAQDTRQLVSMHASERSKAEENAKRLAQETQEATSELERVRAELQAARDELQSTISQVGGLHATIGNLQQQVRDEKAKAAEIADKAQANQETIQSLQEKCENMQTAIEERDNRIVRSEGNNQNLHDNLEDLFADMCSLAQMYQHQESNEESQQMEHHGALEALNQKLTRERKSNQELNSQMTEIREENEKLYRKLGKYKERLEEERNARKQDQDRAKEEEHRRKRNGPVSYLNSLHTSSTNSSSTENDRSRSSRGVTSSSQRPPSQYYKTRDRSTYEKDSDSSGKSRDRSTTHEKENSSSNNYRSSTSQRRTKYY